MPAGSAFGKPRLGQGQAMTARSAKESKQVKNSSSTAWPFKSLAPALCPSLHNAVVLLQYCLVAHTRLTDAVFSGLGTSP